MLDKFTEQLFEMIERCKNYERGSRAASLLPEPREWFYDKNGVIVSKPIESKAASIPSQSINKVRAIHDFIMSNGRI